MPHIPEGKPESLYHIIDAAVVNSKGQTTHLPQFTDGKGRYKGYYPYMAALKAVTSIYSWMKKNDDSFEPDNAPQLIFILQRFSDESIFAYYGKRIPHKQAGKRLVGYNGRVRVYNWQSVVKRIKLSALGYN
jgi:hypothetical protein